MTAVTFDVDKLAAEYSDRTPSDILALAIEHFENLSISFSGAEDVVLIDMAVQIKPDIKVFSLDTGRLHPETYQFIERVRTHYNIQIDLMSPDQKQLENFVQDKGLYSFYQDGHQECCGIRKVMPLRHALSTLDAWITGQRQDQSPDTRQGIPVMQKDNAFSSADRTLIKFNPLARWTSQQVWQYIRENDVPFNELHSKGFASIGCEPCTRAVLPNQHEREGRWWWEEATIKECGLHMDNVNK
jgi:phosphoadenosine phosphosulfate reductase